MVRYLVNYLIMIRINIYEAKTHLSRVLEQVEEGETFQICRRNDPIAEIRPLPKPQASPRPVGKHRGQFKIPPSFHDPLPPEVERAFSGGGE